MTFDFDDDDDDDEDDDGLLVGLPHYLLLLLSIQSTQVFAWVKQSFEVSGYSNSQILVIVVSKRSLGIVVV